MYDSYKIILAQIMYLFVKAAVRSADGNALALLAVFNLPTIKKHI
jgi:hypothetical protein